MVGDVVTVGPRLEAPTRSPRLVALGACLALSACGSSPDDVDVDGGHGGVDGGAPPLGASCATRRAELLEASEETIRVRPGNDGEVFVGEVATTLRQVVTDASEGAVIVLEDGTYTFPASDGGSYTGLYFTTPNVTFRSASGDASTVVLDSAYVDHGGSTAPITVDAPGVRLMSFTVRRSVYHLVHLWANADDAVIHDVVFLDGGQQFLKASPGDGEYVDDVEVSCSRMEMTATGRTNAWGYGASDGSTRCYTGGIDTHDARRWHVFSNRFEGIYCDTETPHPAHGQGADERGGMTYLGGLAEHAIHMWDAEPGGGHVVESNVIVDCARGIGIGLTAEVHDTVVRNNMVFSRYAGSGEHDVGIIVERGHDVRVEHNSVFFSSADAYPYPIEIRWGSTENVSVRHNLVSGTIRERDGAASTLEGNVMDATAATFVDAPTGDLHLATCGVSLVDRLATVPTDVDGDDRSARTDVGADECAP